LLNVEAAFLLIMRFPLLNVGFLLLNAEATFLLIAGAILQPGIFSKYDRKHQGFNL
jgi:hypothetical protein